MEKIQSVELIFGMITMTLKLDEKQSKELIEHLNTGRNCKVTFPDFEDEVKQND